MRILFDTQAFIWFVENDKQLPDKIRKELENIDNTIIISIASLWEMAIKISLDKLHISCDIEEMIDKIYHNGFELLPILPNHIIKLSSLKYLHRDPFDRIIIAQSISEDLTVVTSDEIFGEYGVRVKWKQ
jgi:PIN domain nuclease of toxin-antitoxin system